MSTRLQSCRNGLLLVALLFGQGAIGQRLPPMPSPDLTALEPAVREQLQFSRDRLETERQRSDSQPVQLAALHADLAMLYHAYGLNDAAESSYRHALQLTPRDARLHYYLGYLLEQTGKLDASAKAYQACLRYEPGKLPALLRLAGVLNRNNRSDEAGLVLTLALQLHKGKPSLLAALGEQALAEKNHDDAIALLEAALEQVPAANRLHYPLAMAYRAKGEMDKAKQHLALHGPVGISPHDPLLAELEDLKQGERIHLLRGKRAFAAGDYDAAAEAFRQAIAAKPDSSRAHVNLGSALMQTGNKAQAMDSYQQALKLDPDNATAHFNLGVLLSQEGKLEQAAEHIDRAVTSAPDDSEAHYFLARLYRKLGRTDLAANHYRITVIIDKQHDGAWVDGIDLLLQTGQYEKAQAVAEQAFKALPSDGQVAHQLARLLASNPIMELRDGPRAVELAMKVVKASPTLQHAETLAMAHAQNGQCEEATKFQQQAIDATQAGAEEKARMQRILAHYQASHPCAAPGRPKPEQQTTTTAQ